jgi:hypothetical protein
MTTKGKLTVGGLRKFGWDPRTQEKGKWARSSTQMTQKETMNLPKIAPTFKIVSPLTCALVPPFIGRRRDFYIPKVPSNPRNIPNMNTYMNVFYISYIYKIVSLVHTPNPDFLRQRLWLDFLLVRESSHLGNLHMPRLPNSNFGRLPNSVDSQFHGFTYSWLQVFTGSCHTRFSEGNQVHNCMHARIKCHAYSDIKVNTETVSRKKKKDYQRFTLNPRNEGSKHHRQLTGGCVRLAPATSS